MAGQRNRRWRRSPASPGEDAFLKELLGRTEPSFDRRKPDHKAHMICRQAHEALSLALGDGGADELLDVYVESVEPAPDASRLAVRIALSAVAQARLAEVMEALERHKGRLRAAVAQSITRKRAPDLVFVPSLAGGEGGVR
jgi:ribosome-binding factor A